MNGRKTGGRKAGTPNKMTAEIRNLVRADGPAIFKELVRLAFKSKSEQTRLGAMKEILDAASTDAACARFLRNCSAVARFFGILFAMRSLCL